MTIKMSLTPSTQEIVSGGSAEVIAIITHFGQDKVLISLTEDPLERWGIAASRDGKDIKPRRIEFRSINVGVGDFPNHAKISTRIPLSEIYELSIPGRYEFRVWRYLFKELHGNPRFKSESIAIIFVKPKQ